ncbi:hypothetical protein OJ253_1376 [Cryptosporidium canis]|uniref:Alpha N-terminal protein methyltransferase 1 n=1 Tax=Cryptosporidium canis TaxID=195482 RepID=A0A9D5DHW3_9CRYT|nr:hypothetical protein OJ253_1376 [Cryptosporidium canis]
MTRVYCEGKILSRSEEIWEKQQSTNEGMLDGFIHIHEIDIDNSICFIETLKKNIGMKESDFFEYGIDAGCGIGRVTPTLMNYCKHMDLNEPILKHLTVARKNNPNVRELIHSTLQDFNPVRGRYDFFWIQWALQYLTDDEFVGLLVRIRNSFSEDDINLETNGNKIKCVVCIKENANLNEDEFDPVDESIIRTEKSFLEIFKKANYKCILKMEQTFLPTSFKPIISFAIVPCK